MDETLELLEDSINSSYKLYSDETIRAGDLQMLGPTRFRVSSGEDLRLSNWATTQLLGRLGIPKGYWNRCSNKLKIENESEWLFRNRYKEWVLKKKVRDDIGFNMVRGIVTRHYAPFLNADLMDMVNRSIGMQWKGLVGMVNDEMFLLRMYYPDALINVKGKEVFIGTEIRNSEVGYSSFRVFRTLHLPSCKNVIVMDEILRKEHRGSISNNRWEEMFVGAIENVLDVPYDVRKLADRKVEEKDIEIMNRVGKKMMERVKPEVGERVWDVVNRLTQEVQRTSLFASTDIGPIARRLEVEEIAGELLRKGG